ncbi:hypothetical protein QBC39DRAFT_357351 [Podospora conica]|nr:hypothetical protein QBC39DRAFT_357351 [Schizothecium conicum]
MRLGIGSCSWASFSPPIVKFKDIIWSPGILSKRWGLLELRGHRWGPWHEGSSGTSFPTDHQHHRCHHSHPETHSNRPPKEITLPDPQQQPPWERMPPSNLTTIRRLTTVTRHLTAKMPSSTPWVEPFQTHLSSLFPPTFVLSTLHRQPGSDPVPRARTCVYRGLWGTLVFTRQNPAMHNPPLFNSDCPVFTTDIRMEKAGDLMGTPREGEESGGGGQVEAVWWAPEHGTQWRVRGRAWVLGRDIDGDGEGARAAREAVQKRMRMVVDGSGWMFSREVTGHFGNLSPVMRGSFRGPPPGTPRRGVPGPGEGVGQEVEDLEDGVARANFRVVVILPEEVDQVDLSDGKDPRRWLYRYLGGEGPGMGGEVIGEWEKVELWP